ncbi:MAG: hypothetical protein RR485_05025 [Mucinivorans sp.]
MASITNILSKEMGNNSVIYLYACGEQWCAYEHSAYHFKRIFQMGDVDQKDGFINIMVNDVSNFIDSQAMATLEITSLGDYEVVINCGTVFEGFEDWKEQLLN